MKYFQNRNGNAVAVVAALLETTCRTHLLWSLAPLLMLNHCLLERHRNYLRLCLQEEQEQRRDDSKSCLEDKSCAVGHDLKNNQNTTGLPVSLQDELQNSRPNCVQDQTPDFGQESRPSQIVGHDLKKNQNTTGLPGSLRDETRESRPDCVQIDIEVVAEPSYIRPLVRARIRKAR